MNLHEYQAKQLLRRYEVPAPPGAVAYTPEEAEGVARALGGDRWAVKAQILAGARGEAGGVRLVGSVADVRETARRMLGSTLVTPQTGAQGEVIRRVYVEGGCDVVRELFLGLALDRAAARIALIASASGGSTIETEVARDPAQVHRVALEPDEVPTTPQVHGVAAALGLEGGLVESLGQIIRGLHHAFVGLDATLIEVNPLAVTRSSELIAVDAKLVVDDNALFRHKELRDLREEDEPGRLERARHGFNYLELDGDIGLVVNGAALCMATMDIVKLHGGEPANFLDLPPVADREAVSSALRHVLSDARVRAVLVNVVGGGITRCDAVAEELAAAVKAVGRDVPIVVRFEGANRDLGRKLLRDTGVSFIDARDLEDAARKVVESCWRDS